MEDTQQAETVTQRHSILSQIDEEANARRPTLEVSYRERLLPSKDISIRSLLTDRLTYDNYPPIQRDNVWSLRMRKLYIDTLLRLWPSPPITCFIVGMKFFIDDGRQRLNSIFQFLNGEFPTFTIAELSRIEPEEELPYVQPGKFFNQLDPTFMEAFLFHSIRFEVFNKENMSEREQAVYFRRIQKSKPLTVAETLSSYISKTNSIARTDIAHHAFFSSLYKGGTRQKEPLHMALYCLMLEVSNLGSEIMMYPNLRQDILAVLASGRYDQQVNAEMVARIDENLKAAMHLFHGVEVNSRTEMIPMYQSLQVLRKSGIDIFNSEKGCLTRWYVRSKMDPVLHLPSEFRNRTSLAWGGYSQMTQAGMQESFWLSQKTHMLSLPGLVEVPIGTAY